MSQAIAEVGEEEMKRAEAAGKLRFGFVGHRGSFVTTDDIDQHFGVAGESISMRKAGLLGAAAGAGTSFFEGFRNMIGLSEGEIAESVKGAAATPGGYTAPKAASEWVARQLEPLFTPEKTFPDLLAAGQQVLGHLPETAGALAGAAREDPAGFAGGATGIALGSILPMRPRQFLKGKRLPAVLSWPAEVARTSASPAEFAARLAAPVRRMEEKLRTTPAGAPIGTVADFIDNPDLRAHLPWGVAEQPIIPRKSPGADVQAAEMMVGPMRVEKNLLRPGISAVQSPYAFPELVPNTPEGIFKYVVGEELLHLMRGATPGKVSIRENIVGSKYKKFRAAPTPGRKFSGYTETGPALDYYTQNPQELAAGTALGYIPTRTKRPEFTDFLLPTEETFKRYGYQSAEDFWQQTNSPAFRQGTLRLKEARRAVEHAAKRAVASKPEVVRPPGATGPAILPFMDWLREFGKGF
jgi:hypothetical protein